MSNLGIFGINVFHAGSQSLPNALHFVNLSFIANSGVRMVSALFVTANVGFALYREVLGGKITVMFKGNPVK